ncbi:MULTISPECIES: transcriptional regulator [Streptomyces]|uniref:Transcriptional regulator n=2 Tax=Streptomyces TaxID=1883 RepID=A0ABU4K4Z4_9ACTN|nr:transcriptional regulator [Streptomyces roseolus]MDX2292826.1 transcriptional regulator [Streptomyces roseolus]
MAQQTTVSELRRERFARRLPADLSALRGPARGSVRLPLHLAWSGLTEYDLDRPRLRMSCYRTVLAEGGRDDLVRHLNRDLLVEMWPVLRTLVSKDLRAVWEDAFRELAPEPATASAGGRAG